MAGEVTGPKEKPTTVPFVNRYGVQNVYSHKLTMLSALVREACLQQVAVNTENP